MLFLSLLSLVAALPAPSTSTSTATPSSTLSPALPSSSLLSNSTVAYIHTLLETFQEPGAIVAITKKGQDEILTFGVQDSHNTSMSPDTFFPIASNSKLITALATGLLIHENTTVPNTGKPLTYDTLMTDIMPDFAFDNEDITKTVTLFNVLSMRTGLPGHVLGILRNETTQDFTHRVRYLTTNSQPGEVFQYSNPGYIITSNLFPILVNKTVEEYVEERFFKPLNMSATYDSFVARQRSTLDDGFLRQGLNLTQCTASFAKNSTAGCGTQEAITFWSPSSGLEWAGSGSAILSGHDLVKWTRELINPKVIPPEVIHATEFAFPLSTNATNATDAVGTTYQLGVVRQNYRGFLNTLHDGALPGSNSFFTRFPDQQTGVFVVSNDDMFSLLTNEVVANVVSDDLLGLAPIDWASRLLGTSLTGGASSTSGEQGAVAAAAPVLPPAQPRPEPEGYVNKTYSNGAYGNFTLLPLNITNEESFEEAGLSREFILTDVATVTGLNISGPLYYAKTDLILLTHLLFTHWDGPLYNLTGLYSRERAPTAIHNQTKPQWGSQYLGKTYTVAPVVFGDNGIGFFGDFAKPAESLPGPKPMETKVKESAVVFFDRV